MQLGASLDLLPALAILEARGKTFKIRQLVTATLVPRDAANAGCPSFASKWLGISAIRMVAGDMTFHE